MVLEAVVDRFDSFPDRKAEMVIKLVALDRKWAEGAAARHPAPEARLTAKGGPPAPPGRRCGDAENLGRRRETDAPSPRMRGCEYRGDRRLWHALRAVMRLGELRRLCFSAQRDVASRLRFKSNLVVKCYRAPLQFTPER